MTVTMDVLIPALEDARDSHAAVVDRFRSDMAVTPAGPHRQALQRHLADAEDHILLIDTHVRDIRPRSPLRDTTEKVRTIAEGAIRTTTLPLKIGALVAAGILRGGRQADERQLLKNAEDEYTITARALAVCRAGESIATEADDEEAAGLLTSLRRQDEEILEALEDTVAEHARAVATTNGGRPAQTDGGLTGAATRMMRTAVGRLRDVAQTAGRQTTPPDAGTVREMPDVTQMAQELKGAVSVEEELPIPGYRNLNVTDLTQRLRTLSQSDLTVVEGYERVHANRPEILNTIEGLRGDQPWPDYDTNNPDQISRRLQTADPALVRYVLEYEQRHQGRRTVITAAKLRAAP